MPAQLQAVLADITTLTVDAIVNAANPSLLGAGGVSGAILRSGGSQLIEECRQLGGCSTGEAKLTAGHALPSRFVVHTVGPVWRGGQHDEAHTLANCYRRSLQLAAAAGAHSIAFPSISTGIFGYPFEPAAKIAIDTVRQTLANLTGIDTVLFCCYSRAELEIYTRLLAENASE